jgi:bacteriocin-like protein
LKEKNMSKSNDTTKTRELNDDELNQVSGGNQPVGLMHGDFSTFATGYIDDALGTGVRSGMN